MKRILRYDLKKRIRSYHLNVKTHFMFISTLFLSSLFMLGSHVPMGTLLLLVGMVLQYACSVYSTGYVLRTRISPLYIILFCFVVWCFCTIIWSEDRSLTISKSIDVAEMIIMSWLIYLCFEHEKNVKLLLKVIMWASYVVVFYVLLKYGIHGVMRLSEDGQRIDNEAMNANGIGMSAAYAVILTFYFILHYGPKLWQLSVAPALLVLAVSSSRKGIVLMIVGCMGVLALKEMKAGVGLNTVLKCIVALVLFFCLVFFLLQLPMFSKVNERMISMFLSIKGENHVHDSAWQREQLRALGMQIFLDHPLGGVGLDVARNYVVSILGEKKYTHNNYVELLSCTGIIGFLLYYSVYVHLLIQYWKYRKYGDHEYDICFVLLLTSLMMDYGMVSYESKKTYLVMVLLWLEMNILKKRRKGETYAYLEKSLPISI